MSERIANISLAAIAACVVIMTAKSVFGEKVPPTAATADRTVSDSVWREAVSLGQSRGPVDAPVTILEFGDFECPVCAAATRSLAQLQAQFPNEVRLVYRHWPLPYHENAYRAARMATCAVQEGKFWAVHDLLYGARDSLASVTPNALAKITGIAPDSKFIRCSKDTIKVPSVERDIQDVIALGGSGTPTFIINGKRANLFDIDSATVMKIIGGKHGKK
jgi:protein-disulfide isomerase